jgi:hypothetical protein
MPFDRQLLTISAAVECLTGLALTAAPGTTVTRLLGAPTDRTGQPLGRVTGVALLALGTACWSARRDAAGGARSGTVRAITLYNAGAGLLLLRFAASGQARGGLVWAAGLLHLGLAAGFSVAAAGGLSFRSWLERGRWWRR